MKEELPFLSGAFAVSFALIHILIRKLNFFDVIPRSRRSCLRNARAAFSHLCWVTPSMLVC